MLTPAGGTKITRCEVSLDDGKSWRFADIQRFAPPNAAGKLWAWVHYSLSVPVGAPPDNCYLCKHSRRQNNAGMSCLIDSASL